MTGSFRLIASQSGNNWARFGVPGNYTLMDQMGEYDFQSAGELTFCGILSAPKGSTQICIIDLACLC